jgi:hypothetical protein
VCTFRDWWKPGKIFQIAEFIAQVDPEIKHHITGYILVPRVSWRAPTYDEMITAKNASIINITSM